MPVQSQAAVTTFRMAKSSQAYLKGVHSAERVVFKAKGVYRLVDLGLAESVSCFAVVGGFAVAQGDHGVLDLLTAQGDLGAEL